jgi:hypothetical protein
MLECDWQRLTKARNIFISVRKGIRARDLCNVKHERWPPRYTTTFDSIFRSVFYLFTRAVQFLAPNSAFSSSGHYSNRKRDECGVNKHPHRPVYTFSSKPCSEIKLVWHTMEVQWNGKQIASLQKLPEILLQKKHKQGIYKVYQIKENDMGESCRTYRSLSKVTLKIIRTKPK